MRQSKTWVVVVGLLIGLGACAASGVGGDEQERPSSTAKVIDQHLLAYLSRAQVLHNEADMLEDSNDLEKAEATLSRLIDGKKPSGQFVEVDEVLADAYARKGDIQRRRGHFGPAIKSIEKGLEHAKSDQPTYYQGRLYQVMGATFGDQAKALKAEGDDAKVAQARKRALDASEKAVKIQEKVIERMLGDEESDK